jgi:hypothetical protein
MLRTYLRIVEAILTTILGTALCWGSVGGSISGTVRDASGGLIPKAQVTITNVNTGVSQTVTTSNLGVYSFLALPVGTYKLVVTKQGFETYQRSDITLNTNDQLRYDVTLQVGQVTQEVRVTTSALHVETANTQLGDVIKSRSMEALPLNGRQYTDLLGLQPGVVPADSTPSKANTFDSTEQGNVSISGQRETANGFLVNGANVDNALNNGATIIPNLDSIAEFRVLTADFDAEYGNYSGGMVSVVTKSGTNEWHGDAFEFLRNSGMDSRNFYEYDQTNPVTGREIPGSARGTLRRNQFGGTLGGPIKHDKIFFFADYQGTRQSQGVPSGLILVPTMAERNGDFSSVAPTLFTGAVSGPYFAGLLSQELGYPVTAAEPYYASGCVSSSQCVFPNGIIPQSVFTAPSKALLKYIPLPNEGPYFVSSANDQHTRDDLGSFRIDGNSNRWGMLSAYYFIDDTFQLVPFGTNNTPGFPTLNGGRSQLITLGDTKSFGATALNELHLSWNRYVFHNNAPASNFGVPLSQYGFPQSVPGAIVPANSQFSGVPSIGFNNFSIGLTGVAYNRYEDSPSILDNFSKVLGKHTVKVGGEYTFNDLYEPMPLVGGNGFISFSGTETGSDFADYLIGAPTSFVQEGGFWYDNRRNYLGLYGQDSWRARSDVTLNYGLRYEVFQPWYEKHNQLSTFALGAQSKVYPGAPSGYVFPGDQVAGFGTIPNTISRTPLNNFAPRFGIAYSPSGAGKGPLGWLTGGPGKFSLRGGFGLFYTNVEGSQMLDNTGLAPFDIFYLASAPPLFATPYRNRTDGAVHFEPFPYTPPPPGSTNFVWANYLPLSGYPVPQINAQTPYSENYNFTLQRQFGNNTVFTLGYVGSQGHHLLAGIASDPGIPQLCLSLSQPSEVAPGTPTCGPFGENTVYTRADGTIVNGTRGPFGNNYGDNYWMTTAANSDYNSLQVSLRHTTQRMTFFASYTYSKAMDNTSSLGDKVPDPYNLRVSKALSTFDSTHNFVVSYQYELPFDRLAGNRRLRLTSGWRLVGITRFSTGFPVSLSEVDDRSLLGTFGSGIGAAVDTPNFLGGKLNFTDPRSGKPYFNTSLFVQEQLGYLGTANREFFHGPGFNNFDLSLQKDVKLTESKSMEFRGEFFNAFNHAQFLNPNGNFNSSTFGLVTGANAPRIVQLAVKFLF